MLLYKNIRTLRVVKGLPQKHIADILEINQSYYSRIERGVSDIPISLVVKICEVYSVSIQVLMERDLSKQTLET